MGEAKRKEKRRDSVVKARGPRRRIFERVRAATVGFAIVQQEKKPRVIGSGVILHASGIIATARHVFEELETAVFRGRRQGHPPQGTVFIPGTPQLSLGTDDQGKESATIEFAYTGASIQDQVKLSNVADLALIRVDSAKVSVAPLAFDLEHEVREGDPVATCGWPYGTELHEGKTILSSFLLGNVSAVVPHPKLPPAHRLHYLMQLPVNPGNSGGPAFDPDTGEVYGIVSRRFEPRGIPAGLCVVEPIVRMKDALDDWEAMPDV